MDKDTRNAIERATQRARRLLEEDFAAQLEGDFDVHRDGAVAAKAGGHLSARQAFQRERIVAAIEHKRATGMSAADAASDYLRDAAFTTLNRFVALKMLEARDLVQECITKGEQSAGYREFCGMAPGLPLLPDSAGYRLYIESLFDELSTEVKVLFDRRDPSSVLWPKRATFEQLLEILNAAELARVWVEDETIGWVYQFFNGQDERRKMREESQAPRNSRELAVRNQFFTPRYVVQFLTDNTLGRIWYEMRGTKTALADKCDYMVRKPGEEFSPRAKKDPRDLLVLDPACGSGHFLLYAFDLLLAIYEESYADPASPKSEATGKTLAEDYPTLEALKNAVPGLVLAHNLYGVDIDPRCAQIAQLALWMRAQKAYRDFGIGRVERAQIRRSNIVVAEPLVADEQIAKEFVTKLGDAELGRVFTSLVESLSLAGDLGLLLRVEKLVKPSVQAQLNWLAPSEERIRAALDRFVREEASATNTRRRLFADDAAHGVALLAVAEKKFDAVLMNPPFGAGSTRAKKDFERAYPPTKNDIYAAFVQRGIELLVAGGRLGAITSRTGFFLSTYEGWRTLLLDTATPLVVADLGNGVMDAALVEAAAYCLECSKLAASVPTTFFRLLDADNKAKELARLLKTESDDKEPDPAGQRFDVAVDTFRAIPGVPFCYWAKQPVVALFRTSTSLSRSGYSVKQGLITADDSRFIRLVWEVERRDGWVRFAKGGTAAGFLVEFPVAIRVAGDFSDLIAAADAKYPYLAGGAAKMLHAVPGMYGRPGLGFTRRTTSAFATVAVSENTVFSDKLPLVASNARNDKDGLLKLLGLTNTSVFRHLLELSLGAADRAARSYETGIVEKVPIPLRLDSQDSAVQRLVVAVERLLSSRWNVLASLETSQFFVLPRQLSRDTPVSVGDAQQVLEDAAYELYGLGSADRAAIESAATASTSARDDLDEQDDAAEGPSEEEKENDESYSSAVGSWLVGVSFGRFDPRLATGERAIPPEPEPFDPLPSRSPGMYPEGEEPVDRPDILVDDEGHADDLAARAIAFAEHVKVDAPESVRAWLAKEFFPQHIKMYSKSRRKAPIYWQLATPSASYSVWLYIHAFSKDTLFRVQNDYVAPKLAHEERRLESLTRELRDGATAAQRKSLAAQEAFVDELRTFLDEVKRVAPLWKPNLDDGVIINFAPLWRLVPQNKSWQKELKSTWDALCEGKCDWAHLAMHLWPERVVPKCAKDRSLAIAHGLEDVFWVEGTDGKWTARKTPTRSVEALVHERTSPAVKSALKSLLEAPAAAGSGKRTTRGKANA